MIVKTNFETIWNIGHKSGMVLLMPGVNHITEEQWLAVKDNPQVVHYLGEGVLEVVTEAVAEGEPVVDVDAVQEFKVMNHKKAEKLVKDMYDRDLLKKLIEAETRQGLKAKLKAQLELITPKAASQKHNTEVTVG